MSTTQLRFALVLLMTAWGASELLAVDAASLSATYDHDVRPVLTTYCGKCHGGEKTKGDIDLVALSNGPRAINQTALWRGVLSELLAREMPPENQKQPAEAERQTVITWLKNLKYLEKRDPGQAVIRRLSRVEYDNTIRDLFGVDLKAGTDLPDDRPGETFDNSVSPLLMEKYLLAADDILDRLIVPDQFTMQSPAGQLDAVIEGKPVAGKPDGKERQLDRPGEVTTMLSIPADGTYSIRVTAGGERVDREPLRVGVRFDSQVVAELKITASASKPVVSSVSAKLVSGKTRLSLVFLNPIVTAPAPTPVGRPGGMPPPKATPKPDKTEKPEPVTAKNRTLVIEQIEIIGPPAKRMGDAQRRIFIAVPGPEVSRRAAAQTIAEHFALRAYRRPPNAAEIASLLKVFDLADAQDEVFNAAVKLMLKAILVSPQFLYRTPDFRGDTQSGIVAINDYELASRLSYVVWATMPDEELFTLARENHLHEPAVLLAQIKRLIADPRSRALSENFAATWLELDRVAETPVDKAKFPQLTQALRQAMYDEGVAQVDDLLRTGGSLLDLIDSDYAWMNAQTAKVYEVDSVSGSQMQKVRLNDRNRGGVLTMPGVLLVTSEPNRTSPVRRGKWVLEQLLGGAPPPPPPNVASLDQQNVPANVSLTLRQKTERHRSDPACASCHTTMDAIGFGLENFDAIGRWRTKDDTGGTVDAIGELPGKQRFTSPSELKRILMSRKDEFVRNVISRLLGFALGRKPSGYDEVVIDEILQHAVTNNYRVDGIVTQILTSYPFLNRPSYRLSR